jgi:hypothetical protein
LAPATARAFAVELRFHVRLQALLLPLLLACQTQPAFAPKTNDTPEACEARKAKLVALVGALPEQSLGTAFHVELPESTLGSTPGAGSVLEVTETSLVLDGATIDPAAWPVRAKVLSAGHVVYVAAAPDVTIRTLRAAVLPLPRSVKLGLLVRVHAAAALPAEPDTPPEAQTIASRVLTERDPAVRKSLAEKGYAEFSSCPAVSAAVASAGTAPPNGRWPTLHAELARALPSCACGSFDAGAMRALVTAEQRAGTASLGVLPLDFVRDERCEASMGLRSVKRLLEQMEQFDADYAGKITDDSVRFEQVITSDRLLVEFCDALPGETLATLERKKATLYWRVAGSSDCEAWTFAPLAPGAPMGTVRRAAGPHAPAAAFHYWQAAEEISVFGPASSDPPSKPTDERDWACRVSYKLVGVDADSVAFENGRWFFDEATCRAANDAAAAGGCAVTEGG